MKKINIKYFMPPGEILRCTAQCWLYFTRLAKITSSYTIDSERGARASRKLAAFRPKVRAAGLHALFFRQKRQWTRRPGAGAQAYGTRDCHMQGRSTGACNATYNGACKRRKHGARMAVQHCAARAQAPQAPMIGLDEPPGQVHSVPAQG